MIVMNGPARCLRTWELIGVPHRITVGERGLKEGKLEYVDRRTLQTTSCRWAKHSRSSRRSAGFTVHDDACTVAADCRRRVIAIAAGAPLWLTSLRARGAQQITSRSPMRCAMRWPRRSPMHVRRYGNFDKIEGRMGFCRWLGRDVEAAASSKADDYCRGSTSFDAGLRGDARRFGPAVGARLDPGRKQVPQIRHLDRGARGYMQVMPFWTRVIGDGESRKLFSTATNLRYGSVILRHYLDIERGDLFMGLGRYNGSRGRRTIRTR